MKPNSYFRSNQTNFLKMKISYVYGILASLVFLKCFESLEVSNMTKHRKLNNRNVKIRHLYDQKLTIYFSNPRAASLFMTDRINIYGSGRYHFLPKIEEGSSKTPSARWMMRYSLKSSLSIYYLSASSLFYSIEFYDYSTRQLFSFFFFYRVF